MASVVLAAVVVVVTVAVTVAAGEDLAVVVAVGSDCPFCGISRFLTYEKCECFCHSVTNAFNTLILSGMQGDRCQNFSVTLLSPSVTHSACPGDRRVTDGDRRVRDG